MYAVGMKPWVLRKQGKKQLISSVVLSRDPSGCHGDQALLKLDMEVSCVEFEFMYCTRQGCESLHYAITPVHVNGIHCLNHSVLID